MVVCILNHLPKSSSTSLEIIIYLSSTITRTLKKKCTLQVFLKKVIIISK
jgi:hypothetical protein